MNFGVIGEMCMILIHLVPSILMYNITYVTMVNQKHLPEEQQRFLSIERASLFSSEGIYERFSISYEFYLVWAVLNYFIVYVMLWSTIERRGWIVLYHWFMTFSWAREMAKKCDSFLSGASRLVYFGLHLCFFSLCNAVSAIVTESDYFMIKMTQVALCFAIFNGGKAQTNELPALQILKLARNA
jgi:hypothetical protein